AFLGDIYGQLVMVKTGRPWLPTETVQAIVSPVQLTIIGQRSRQLQLSPYPYALTMIEHASSPYEPSSPPRTKAKPIQCRRGEGGVERRGRPLVWPVGGGRRDDQWRRRCW